MELIAASAGVKIQVIAKICKNVLNGFGIPVGWALSIVVLVFKGKADIRNFLLPEKCSFKSLKINAKINCSCHRAVKFLEHGMKMEMKMDKLYGIIKNAFQNSNCEERLMLHLSSEEHYAKGNILCTYIVDLEKAFDRVLRIVFELAMRKKGIPEALVWC